MLMDTRVNRAIKEIQLLKACKTVTHHNRLLTNACKWRGEGKRCLEFATVSEYILFSCRKVFFYCIFKLQGATFLFFFFFHLALNRAAFMAVFHPPGCAFAQMQKRDRRELPCKE